jgi:DNA-directed RNA polymerase
MAGTKLEEQTQLEREALEAGMARYAELAAQAARRGEAAKMKPVEKLIAQWFYAMKAKIVACKQAMKDGAPLDNVALWGPVVYTTKSDVLATITLYTMMEHLVAPTLDPERLTQDGDSFTAVAYRVGRAVIAEAVYRQIKKGEKRPDEDSLFERLRKECSAIDPENVQWFANKYIEDPCFDRKLAIYIGTTLVWYAQGECLCNGKPAFEIKMRTIDNKTKRWIRLDEDTRRHLRYVNEARAMLRPMHMPMIVPPMPWQQDDVEKGGKVHSGGYIVNHTPLVSGMTRSHKNLIRKHDIREFLHHLNVEASVPLSPDHYMIATVQEAWKSGSKELLHKLGIPPRDYVDMPDRAPDGSTEEQINARKAERAKVYDKNIEIQSHRQYVAGVMSVVDRVKHYDKLWLPAQADYRTRTYSIPTQMSFQASEWQRVMLRFAQAVPVSERGRHWIKVHAANCWGIDKVSFEERVKWVDGNMDRIRRAYERGLDDEWWMQAEQPLPFLAACRGLCNEEDAARIGVEMDGSANGLQWFAAMGRDEVAAEAVNLTARTSPADPYKAVMNEAIRRCNADTNPLASIAAKLIDRTVCKSIVMPMSYGQTDYAAKEAVKKHLISKGFCVMKGKYAVLSEEAQPLWHYMDKTLQAAIGVTNAKAKQIMRWMAECAYECTTTEIEAAGKQKRVPNTNTMRLVTPLGFPVEQWQRDENELRTKTIAGWVTIKYSHDRMPSRPSKQSSAISPNVVHSYDATHKAMWLKKTVDAGFGARHRHDCFTTHAEHTDQSQISNRKIFRQLNETDPLNVVYEQWKAMYPQANLNPPPERGNFDLSLIDGATYMFH